MSNPKLNSISINNVDFGENITIVQPVNLYGCKIEGDNFIGPFVEIQQGVSIGRGTKIQSHTFICELVSIGENCVVAHGVMFINDLFQSGSPAGGNSVDPNNKNQILEAIKEIIQYNSSDFDNIKSISRDLHLKEYNWENQEKKLLGVYNNLIQS